jgi:hypothetical protein
VTVLLSVSPTASNWILEGRLFPPLGDETIPLQTVAVVIAVLIVLVTYRRRFAEYKVKRWKAALLSLVILSACVYGGAYFKFVRRVGYAKEQGIDYVYVSIGCRRTSYAIEKLSNHSDVELLEARGLDDDDIKQVWTPNSVLIARSVLFVSFCMTLLPVVGILSLTALEHAKQTPEDSTS